MKLFLTFCLFSLCIIHTTDAQKNPYPLSKQEIEKLLSENNEIINQYALKSLSNLSIEGRSSYLLTKAKQVVLTCAPEYFRIKITPRILSKVVEKEETRVPAQINQKIYEVTFFYDKEEEMLEYDFAAKVIIFEQNGEPFKINVGGSDIGLIFDLQSFEELRLKGELPLLPYNAISPNSQPDNPDDKKYPIKKYDFKKNI